MYILAVFVPILNYVLNGDADVGVRKRADQAELLSEEAVFEKRCVAPGKPCRGGNEV